MQRDALQCMVSDGGRHRAHSILARSSPHYRAVHEEPRLFAVVGNPDHRNFEDGHFVGAAKLWDSILYD